MATETLNKTRPYPGQRMLMSYEEYLELDTDGLIAEWVDGEVIVHMPPKSEHQSIVEFLYILIALFVNLFNLGKTRIAPFEMRAIPGKSAREPDLLFVSNENISRWTRERIAGTADLAVEVVSTDSVYRDRVEKFQEYEAGGVREYWVIDSRPGRLRAEFWVLDDSGRYQAGEKKDGVYHSTVIRDFWIRVEWLLAEELPEPLAALAQVAGAEKVAAVLNQGLQLIRA